MSLPMPPPIPRHRANVDIPNFQNEVLHENQTNSPLQSESQSQKLNSSSLAHLFITPNDIDEGSWFSWKDVPKETRTKIWEAFMGNYTWDQAFQQRIQKRWNFLASMYINSIGPFSIFVILGRRNYF